MRTSGPDACFQCLRLNDIDVGHPGQIFVEERLVSGAVDDKDAAAGMERGHGPDAGGDLQIAVLPQAQAGPVCAAWEMCPEKDHPLGVDIGRGESRGIEQDIDRPEVALGQTSITEGVRFDVDRGF